MNGNWMKKKIVKNFKDNMKMVWKVVNGLNLRFIGIFYPPMVMKKWSKKMANMLRENDLVNGYNKW